MAKFFLGLCVYSLLGTLGILVGFSADGELPEGKLLCWWVLGIMNGIGVCHLIHQVEKVEEKPELLTSQAVTTR